MASATVVAAILVASGVAVAATMVGTEGNDTLNGTQGDDTMSGYGGSDWFNASGGSDVVYGGPGNDTTGGGAGADKLHGQEDNDTMNDGPSTEVAVDELYGGPGDDKVNAGAGNDVLRGESGIDAIRGGLGNDTADGGLGTDNLSGQEGDDTLYDGPPEDLDPDVIDGGPGNDTVRANGGGDTVLGQAGNDQIDGGPGNDTLYGTDSDQSDLGGDDVVSGSSGDDQVLGAAGADRLSGGDGNDVLIEGPVDDASVDTLEGGLGDDRIYAASGRAAVDAISCQDGRDEVWVDPNDTVGADCEVVHNDPALAEVTFTQPVSVEKVTQLGSQNEAAVSVIETESQVGTEKVHDFYVPESGATPQQIRTAVEEARLGSFEDSLSTMNLMKTEDRNELEPQREAMQTALQNNDPGPVNVSEVLLSGDLQDLQAMAEVTMSPESGDSTIAEVKVAGVDDVEAKVEGEALSETESTAGTGEVITGQPGVLNEETAASGDTMTTEAGTFYPNVGYSNIRQSVVAGKRYSEQYFKWNNNTLVPGDTYEHDIRLDGRDKRTYLTYTMTGYPGCFPNGFFMRTFTEPGTRPYVDTNFNFGGCYKESHPAYSIGFADAAPFRNGKMYRTYLRVNQGAAPGDGMVIQGQVGYRNEFLCRRASDAFCVFSRATRNLLGQMGRQYYYVPSSWGWVE